jgi:hypothetical protein
MSIDNPVSCGSKLWFFDYEKDITVFSRSLICCAQNAIELILNMIAEVYRCPKSLRRLHRIRSANETPLRKLRAKPAFSMIINQFVFSPTVNT